VTYLYAGLGMAMLIPILVSLEMSGALFQQELQAPSASLKATDLGDARELLGYLSELREDKASARADLSSKIDKMPTYCEALEEWIEGRVSAGSVWSDFQFVKRQPDRCHGFSKAGMKVIVLGSFDTGNPPPRPLEDFGVLACNPSLHPNCGLEDG